MEAFVKSCPQMLLAKFGANQSNGLGGVGKSKFIIFFFYRALLAYGEVVTWVSCQ